MPGILAFFLFQQTVPLLSMAGLALAGTMAAPLYAAMTHLIELCLNLNHLRVHAVIHHDR